jgi:hypothetical protein
MQRELFNTKPKRVWKQSARRPSKRDTNLLKVQLKLLFRTGKNTWFGSVYLICVMITEIEVRKITWFCCTSKIARSIWRAQSSSRQPLQCASQEWVIFFAHSYIKSTVCASAECQ